MTTLHDPHHTAMIPMPRRTVIIASKAGRLGNRLFLSGYLMANAMARGYNLWNLALGEYASSFEGSVRDPLCGFPEAGGAMEEDVAVQCREVLLSLADSMSALMPWFAKLDIRRTIDAVDGVYDLNGQEFARILRENTFLALKGWKFRDDANLMRFHGEISRYFRPVARFREPAEAALCKARALGEEVVGVHIRQGDYREWKNGVHYFETEQYVHWMRGIRMLFPSKKLAFLVCASDPVDGSSFHGLDVVMGPGSVVGDMHALSLCDRIMGPPSTYSTWASYSGRVPLCMLEHHRQDILPASFTFHDRV